MLVAADNAIMSLPEAGLGIIPDAGGVLRLPRRMPAALANEMMMTGKRLSAAEALQWGLANQVVPGPELMTAARALAERVTASAPLSLRAIKAAQRAAEGMGVQEAYALLRSGKVPVYQQMLDSEDAKEGPRAFAEKRAPQWKGR